MYNPFEFHSNGFTAGVCVLDGDSGGEDRRCMDRLTCERDSLGSREDRVCLFLLWASRSTNITDHEQPCSGEKQHIDTAIAVTSELFMLHR